MPPAPASKTAQNASRMLPGVTKANTPADLPEAKQTKLDSVLDLLDELVKQDLETVIEKIMKVAESGLGCASKPSLHIHDGPAEREARATVKVMPLMDASVSFSDNHSCTAPWACQRTSEC